MTLSPLHTSLIRKTRSASGIQLNGCGVAEQYAQLALAILQTRHERKSFFDAALFAEASWDILLNLRAHHDTDRLVASMFVSECAATSTGLRHLDKLKQNGLVERWDDPNDGRRRFARLSKEGLARMNHFLSSIQHH